MQLSRTKSDKKIHPAPMEHSSPDNSNSSLSGFFRSNKIQPFDIDASSIMSDGSTSIENCESDNISLTTEEFKEFCNVSESDSDEEITSRNILTKNDSGVILPVSSSESSDKASSNEGKSNISASSKERMENHLKYLEFTTELIQLLDKIPAKNAQGQAFYEKHRNLLIEIIQLISKKIIPHYLEKHSQWISDIENLIKKLLTAELDAKQFSDEKSYAIMHGLILAIFDFSTVCEQAKGLKGYAEIFSNKSESLRKQSLLQCTLLHIPEKLWTMKLKKELAAHSDNPSEVWNAMRNPSPLSSPNPKLAHTHSGTFRKPVLNNSETHLVNSSFKSYNL